MRKQFIDKYIYIRTMKKLNNYLRPAVKVRQMENVMLDINSGLGGNQLGTGKGNGARPVTPPTEMPQNNAQDIETLPKKKSLWDD